MEEVLGTHVDDDTALVRRIQQVGWYRNRDSYLTLTYLSATTISHSCRLTGHVAYPASQPAHCVPLLGYSGYVWHRR
jgi:hypothetical protein